MTDTRYNGWKNKETWLANLYLTNEEPLYRASLAAVASVQKTAFKASAKRSMLAEELRRILTDVCTQGAKHWQTDFLLAALARVDFEEIAKGFHADATA